MEEIDAEQVHGRARIVERVRKNPRDGLRAPAWSHEVGSAHSYSYILRAMYTRYPSSMKPNTKGKKRQTTKNMCSIITTIYYRLVQVLVRRVSSEICMRLR